MREADIRPRELMQGILEASERDIQTFFADRSTDTVVDCPACAHSQFRPAFTKLGFAYVTCQGCSSLYMSPRPAASLFGRYLAGSEMGRYFQDKFYSQTEQARVREIYRPRAAQVAAASRSHQSGEALRLVDIGSGCGHFLNELRAHPWQELSGIEPDAGLARTCRERGFTVFEGPVETVDTGSARFDMATCFEVLEHVHTPLDFLQGIVRLLAPGGLLYLTTLTITGFDMQVLWEHSRSIYPPHHINLLSLDGFARLFERAGLRVVSITTPGRLDLDIVANTARDLNLELPRFVRTLLDKDPAVRDRFQLALQECNLSSHVHVVGQLPARP